MDSKVSHIAETRLGERISQVATVFATRDKRVTFSVEGHSVLRNVTPRFAENSEYRHGKILSRY